MKFTKESSTAHPAVRCRRLSAAEVADACVNPTPKKKTLKANSKTAVWGYYYKAGQSTHL